MSSVHLPLLAALFADPCFKSRRIRATFPISFISTVMTRHAHDPMLATLSLAFKMLSLYQCTTSHDDSYYVFLKAACAPCTNFSTCSTVGYSSEISDLVALNPCWRDLRSQM